MAVVGFWLVGAVRRRGIAASDLLAALLLAMSLHTVRYAPFFVLAAVPTLAVVLGDGIEWGLGQVKGKKRRVRFSEEESPMHSCI